MNSRHSTVPTPRTAPPALVAVLFVAGLLAGCGGTRPEAPPQETVAPLPPTRVDPVVPPVKIGLALGGGAA